jgi:hypothetical protein
VRVTSPATASTERGHVRVPAACIDDRALEGRT